MQQYKELIGHIVDNGVIKSDRTGVGTKSVFGYQMRFDLQKGFPLVTLKHTSFKNIAAELLWFLDGTCNKLDLQAIGCKIWDEWDAPNPRYDGDMGPIYGVQWRSWDNYAGGAIDQIADVIERIKKNPNDRRLIVSAWNVADLPEMALPPCHVLFQFYVADGKLSCQLYQRSADVFLGVPYNIASYALLTHMIAQVCGLGVGEFIWTGGDCHLYLNHMDQVKELWAREPKPLPRLMQSPGISHIDEFTLGDFVLVGYDPHPKLSAPVAV